MAAASSRSEVPLWRRPRAERYLKLNHIAAGSYGSVSLALDLLTNQRVAIKKQAVESDACQREFAFFAALGAHPSEHVAQMLDYFTTTDQNAKFLQTVHPLADSTLWQVFKFSRGHLPDSRVAKYVFGVAMGLSHLNSLGIVHADASLKHMLLMREDHVQVADLGAAFSAMGVMSGDDEITTEYVRSPERLLGERVVRPSIDVWAFGVQFFCLRAGQCPWLIKGDGNEALHSAHLLELAKVIGRVPSDSQLRNLPKWPTLSKGMAVDGIQPSCLRDGWSTGAQSLCKMALCWEPSDRASWECILANEIFVSIDTAKPSLQRVPSSTSPVSSLAPLAPAGTSATQGAGAEAKETGAEAMLDALKVKKSQAMLDTLEVKQSTPGDSCQCKGNCGSLVHKARANLRYRASNAADVVVCDGTTKFGQRLCGRCKCEIAECGHLRLQDNKRWCAKHVIALTTSKYAVPSGVHSFCRAWPPLVRAVARLAHFSRFASPRTSL